MDTLLTYERIHGNNTSYAGDAPAAAAVGFKTKTWNSLPTHWQDQQPVAYNFHLAVGVFMIPVTITALLGNSLVIWIFAR